MSSVLVDGLSQTTAAPLHGIPCSSLRDRLSGRVIHGINPGPRPYLTLNEESELADFLVDAAKIGYGRTRRDVKGLVETYLQKKGGKGEDFMISNGWWDKFMKRHRNLSLCSGDATAKI